MHNYIQLSDCWFSNRLHRLYRSNPNKVSFPEIIEQFSFEIRTIGSVFRRNKRIGYLKITISRTVALIPVTLAKIGVRKNGSKRWLNSIMASNDQMPKFGLTRSKQPRTAKLGGFEKLFSRKRTLSFATSAIVP